MLVSFETVRKLEKTTTQRVLLVGAETRKFLIRQEPWLGEQVLVPQSTDVPYAPCCSRAMGPMGPRVWEPEEGEQAGPCVAVPFHPLFRSLRRKGEKEA